MILVDTSVWVDHLRHGDSLLSQLLEAGQVLMHPFVTGELSCGNLRDRPELLFLFQHLPAAQVAQHDEVLHFIERHALFGKGVGYGDVHLLAAVALTPPAVLWTRDKRLRARADAMALGFRSASGLH